MLAPAFEINYFLSMKPLNVELAITFHLQNFFPFEWLDQLFQNHY